MGFNQSKFNRSKFNIKNADRIKWIYAVGVEAFSASIGTSLQYWFHAIGYERINAQIAGNPGKFISASGLELFSGNTAGLSVAFISSAASEIFSQEAILGADIFLTIQGVETFTANIVLGAVIWVTAEATETFTADIVLGAVIWVTAESFELFSSSASAESTETKICYIGTASQTFTLRPGERLIVDANNYNVLLNGENAIWYQAGDWIDELDRETVNIDIIASSGSANLSANILYQERYL